MKINKNKLRRIVRQILSEGDVIDLGKFRDSKRPLIDPLEYEDRSGLDMPPEFPSGQLSSQGPPPKHIGKLAHAAATEITQKLGLDEEAYMVIVDVMAMYLQKLGG